MPVDNPFVPRRPRAAARLAADDPTEAFSFEKRVSETGPRTGTIRHTTYYQATLGLSGDVLDDWKYEVYAQIGANDQVNHQTGNVLTSKIEELTFAPDGGVSICGGFDPFGLGSISPECMDYISIDASNHAAVDQTIAEASLSGPLLALPAGDLQAAFGVFYKEDKYQYTASPVASVVPQPAISFRSSGRTYRGSARPTTSRATTTTSTSTRNCSCPCFATRPARSRWRRCSAIGCRTMHRPAASIPGRRSCSTSRSMPCACAAPTSRRFGRRACSSSTSRSCRRSPTSSFSRMSGSLRRRQPGEDRAGRRAGRGAVPRAGHAGVALLPDFAGSDVRDRSHRRKSRPRSGGGHHEHDRRRLDVAAVASAALEPAAVARLVPKSTSPTRSNGGFLRVRAVLLRRAATTRTSRSRTSGARCSRATRSTGEIDDVQETQSKCVRLEDERCRRAGRLAVRPRARAARRELARLVAGFVHDRRGRQQRAVDRGLAGTIGELASAGSLPEWKSNLHVSYAWRDLTVGASWRYIDSMTDADSEPGSRVPDPAASTIST